MTRDEKPMMKSMSNPLKASIESNLCDFFSIIKFILLRVLSKVVVAGNSLCRNRESVL